MMSVAVISSNADVSGCHSPKIRHEPVGAQRARPPGAGGPRPLHGVRVRRHDGCGDRRAGGSDGEDVLPAFRRQTRSAVLWPGRAHGIGDDAHRRRSRLRIADRGGGRALRAVGDDFRGAPRTRPTAPGGHRRQPRPAGARVDQAGIAGGGDGGSVGPPRRPATGRKTHRRNSGRSLQGRLRRDGSAPARTTTSAM